MKQKQTLKKLFLNIMQKGGTGKTTLSLLAAYKNSTNPKVIFIDADSSTRSLSRSLSYLKSNETERVFKTSLLNPDNNIIDRTILFNDLEAISKIDFEIAFMDFGAPESEQFQHLFNAGFTPLDFQKFIEHLGLNISLNLIVGGGISYIPSTEYLKRISSLLFPSVSVNICVNEYLFQNHRNKYMEIEAFAKSFNDKMNVF